MEGIQICIWLIIFALLLVIEIETVQLVTIWFAAGAAAACVTAMFGATLKVQLIIFLIVSLILLMLVRPLAGKCLKTGNLKTNIDSLIGEYATVTAKINNAEGFGKAVIRGQEWTAAAKDECESFEAGQRVKIIAIQGVKLIVTSEKKCISINTKI